MRRLRSALRSLLRSARSRSCVDGSARGAGPGSTAAPSTWKFAVSGDSRNCGDIVDAGHCRRRASKMAPPSTGTSAITAPSTCSTRITCRLNPDSAQTRIIKNAAWPDFINHQLKPFGSLPIFLAIGNHELIQPKTHDASHRCSSRIWYDSPVIRQQRLSDDPDDHLVKTYYHWQRPRRSTSSTSTTHRPMRSTPTRRHGFLPR